MDVSFWFTCRRYDRRTRRWRFWWIRWGTCCGMSTPCWRSGNNGPTSSTFFKETPPQKLELHNGKDQVKKGISVGFWIRDHPLVAHLFCARTPSLKLTTLSQISEELLLFILYYIVGGQTITAMGWIIITSYTPVARQLITQFLFAKWSTTLSLTLCSCNKK